MAAMAARLIRARVAPLPLIRLAPRGRSLELRFPRGWLTDHPLTRADLIQEVAFLKAAGFRLRVY